MALLKNIELNNGVNVNYHRIVSLNCIVNNKIIIEVASYTSEEKRIEEKNFYKEETPTTMNVFLQTSFIELAYDENINVKNAYEYLKTTDMFINAKDI